MNSIPDVRNKKVLLRVDFDVPVEGSTMIAETFRIKKQKPMVDWLLERGAKVVMVGHISAVDSFKVLMPQFEEILGRKIRFLEDLEQSKVFGSAQGEYSLALFENTRRWPGEKENSEEFARALVWGSDLYVNNDFAVCHRNHASVSAITKFLPSYGGLRIEEEIRHLERVLAPSEEGKILILGGAKADTKIPVIKNFLDKTNNILLGGVVLNDILQARGLDVRESRVSEHASEALVGIDVRRKELVVPDDFVWNRNMIVDIGEHSREVFARLIYGATLIVWNGPMGMFEDGRFSKGTEVVAHAVADAKAFSVIGGGDTIAAVDKFGLLDAYGFVSTGGGAMLAFLAGERLPGLAALGYYD